MTAPNPFDALDLTDIVNARHLLNWYARLEPVYRQRIVDTIIDNAGVISFIGQAAAHTEHSPGDFDQEALHDLAERMQRKVNKMSR